VLVLGVYDDLTGQCQGEVRRAGRRSRLFYLLGGRIVTLSIPFVGSVTLHPILDFC